MVGTMSSKDQCVWCLGGVGQGVQMTRFNGKRQYETLVYSAGKYRLLLNSMGADVAEQQLQPQQTKRPSIGSGLGRISRAGLQAVTLGHLGCSDLFVHVSLHSGTGGILESRDLVIENGRSSSEKRIIAFELREEDAPASLRLVVKATTTIHPLHFYAELKLRYVAPAVDDELQRQPSSDAAVKVTVKDDEGDQVGPGWTLYRFDEVLLGRSSGLYASFLLGTIGAMLGSCCGGSRESDAALLGSCVFALAAFSLRRWRPLLYKKAKGD